MNRGFNFCAGPATLPLEILQKAQAEFLSWQGSDISVVEFNHRAPQVAELFEEAEKDLREILSIPQTHKILFLAGGASVQFAMAALAFADKNKTVDYVCSGYWSRNAVAEAERYAKVNVVANTESTGFTTLLPESDWTLSANPEYLYFTDNETINGVEFNALPDIDAKIPLISDMTSNILSRPIDFTRFGMIFAGAQKNLSAAGLTLVIIREDMIERTSDLVPSALNYKVQTEKKCLYNTPPVFQVYLLGLMLKWLQGQGGLNKINQINAQKAAKLYEYIDSGDFYSNNVDKKFRSKMNVPFLLADANLDEAFVQQAKAKKLYNIKGHRSVGGMRASIYNAMPMAGVDALLTFMKEFEKANG